MVKKINIAVLGHLDHGKSTLIGRLLYDAGVLPKDKIKEIKEASKCLGRDMEFAFFTDTFEEERKDAMTIDVIHTSFRTKKYEYNLIDCPGHREFIRNMLTGTSQAEGVILVISAKPNEGVQEQTKRHIFLAKMLGIKQLFIVVNKMDTAKYDKKRFLRIKEETVNLLKSVSYGKNIPFIPISAKRGDNIFKKSTNMSWYRGKPLIETLDERAKVTNSLINKPLRISVQGVYDDKDDKIIFGRVESGILKLNNEVYLNLCKEKGKIIAIKYSQRNKKESFAGDCVGLKLSGVDYNQIRRGEVCSSLYNKPEARKEFVVKIFILNGNIQKNDRLIIRCGTAEKSCKIKEIMRKINSENGRIIRENTMALNDTEAGEVRISTDEPLVIEKFSQFPTLGRFLLIKENKIISVGIIM